jgi:hypothetical protein
VSLCKHCHERPIPPRHRVYCEICSPRASQIWKVRERRRFRVAWRSSSRTGPPPYLDGWESREDYRAYYRNYMREWRKRRKASVARSEPTGGKEKPHERSTARAA